jgi:uncharacterized protein (DUF362 family)
MKGKNRSDNNLSRRDFIKRTSISALGLSFMSAIPSIVSGSIVNPVTAKSRVVLVRNVKVITENGDVNNALLSEMLKTAIEKFSGEKSNEAFWKKYFSPEDIVGLKINTLGLNSIAKSSVINHFSAFTTAIIENCKAAGFNEENFIVWDRSNDELINAGYTIQKENGKTKVLGAVESRGNIVWPGFSEEYTVGDKTTRITKILTEMCTKLINIPVLKDHGSAGFTGALKNHYGTINNARDFHSDNCTNPGIPEINMLEPIRSKQKLIIADALLGVFNGGPRWNRDSMWPYGGILISTDPVAIDTVMLGIINEKRKSENMSLINDNVTKHIRLSKEMGLGTNNPEEIDLVKIDLG